MSGTPYILYLPEVALEKIFSYLTYDEIAKNRIVCKRFNTIGKKMLSRGFVQIERRHAAVHKKIKLMLPRRESERKTHPLARYCEVLSALETRISMLNMTFSKYIDNDLCCFIPGKVLDEIQRLLMLVQNGKSPLPRSHELLQEMRDISSMAMEHFEEHILPNLRSKLESRTASTLTMASKAPRLFLVQQTSLTQDIRKIKKQSKTYRQHVVMLSQQISQVFKKVKHQSLRLKYQNNKLLEQERKIQDQSLKIQELESFLGDLKKRVEERDQKKADKEGTGTEVLELKPSAATTNVLKSQSSPPKFYKTNIRPRVAQILPVYGSLQFELERKRKSSVLGDIPNKLSRETKELINNKINENITRNITSNISKNISSHFDDGGEKKETDFGSLLTSSVENILKNSLAGLRARKRKSTEEIDLK